MTTLVLLPGMDGTGRLFGPFVEAMGAETRTIVVAYPADESLGPRDLERIARSHLPADVPFVLLGESFSGPIAIAIAASPPPGLRGLVLCCSFVSSPRPALRWLAPLTGVMPLRADALFHRALLGRFATPERRRALTEAISEVEPGVLRRRLRAVLATDVRPLLARVRVPVLCLCATEDRVVPRSAAGRILRALPTARLSEIEGPHLLLQSSPDTCAKVVADFVREVSGGE